MPETNPKTHQRIPKPIRNQNFLNRFQSWCWTVAKKNKVKKDQTTLEIVHVKKSTSLISWENFGVKLKELNC